MLKASKMEITILDGETEIKINVKTQDGSANRGAAVYAYGKNTDFGASIKIVTNLQKSFQKMLFKLPIF